jgi:4-diphosphocytidyl-2-C-methyl-D-erythritol kinase
MKTKGKSFGQYSGYANAKINVGLRVLAKRKDGYHNLETIFYPVKLADKINFKIKELPDNSKNSITVKTTPLVALNDRKNICYITVKLFLNRFKIKGNYSIDINIKKNIPTGAGLGGGSSDAAFVLNTLARHFKLKKNNKDIFRLALNLGSDVPFFLLNKPAYASGRGEKLTPLPQFKINGKLLIVNPRIHISTPWAFKQIGIKKSKIKILNKIKKADLTDERLMINDFERVVFKKYPEIERIKYDMMKFGAAYSIMSGSGSTVYAVFESKKNFAPAKKYFTSKRYMVIEG